MPRSPCSYSEELGFAHVPPGITRYLTIELDEELLSTYGYGDGAKAIVPMLHVDADSNDSYEFPDGPTSP